MLIAGASLVATVALAQGEDERYEFQIQSQSLGDALEAFVTLTDAGLIYPQKLAEAANVNAVIGQYTIKEALDVLLEGTRFSGGLTKGGTIVVSLDRTKTQDREGTVNSGNIKKGLLASASAFLFGAGGHAAAQDDVAAAANGGERDTIIVTATKRSQDVQDVPASIAVISSDDITRRSLVSMGDYLNSIPGVTFIDSGPGLNQAVIRGIGLSQFEQATVSTYFGEVPLTDSVSSSGEIGGSSADLKLVDLERVEVLKGPQGTLFGSGAMGGVIRNVPAAPKLNVLEGDLTAGLAVMSDSDDLSNTLTGAVNLPLVEDRLALRVVGYRFDTAGYIDRVSTPPVEAASATAGLPVDEREDTNGHSYVGGRASLLWQATDEFKVTVIAATQRLEEESASLVDLTLDGYKFSVLATPGVEDFNRDDIDFINVVAEYDLGWASLLGSYTHLEGEKVRQDFFDGFFLGAIRRFSADKETDVVEFRIASQLDGPLQFVGGLYYEEFDRRQNQIAEWGGSDTAIPFGLTPLPSSPGPNGLSVIYEFPVNRFESLEHKALFGEISYEILPGLTATGGVRWFDYDRELMNLGNNFFGLSGIVNAGAQESDTNFKASLAYEPTRDSLLYFTWSEGFRLGAGQDVPPASLCDIDDDGNLDFTNAPLNDTIGSDSTTNYELGGKFSLFNNRLALNAAAYRINWKNIPVTVFDTSDACPGFLTVTANAGEARSQGVEFDGVFEASEGLQFLFSFAYTDTEFLNDAIASSGDRLPLSPEFNYSVGLQYDTKTADHEIYLRTDYSYIDGFMSNAVAGFAAPSEAYGRWNIRAGIDLDPVRVSIYGNNILNTNADTIGFELTTGRRVAPRVVGVEVGYRF